ncbi:PACE efflux transporter [Salmonella enterica subsp. enterica]|uniref:PACE efflux transporter n=1 Tax=Serratia TaxID=613 RepID=UPI000B5E7F3F|nr:MULTISPECIES: PACE efflux transporter [Serratia]EBQ2012520.1 PACE efflux transporter [Salmonella enterica subsp. enterica]ASL95908.1 hypothetical protein BVG94_24780 [Serratia marcescens]ECJ6738118.1 PACE efflux transporter [Salmonella enterica subsp. enterica]MBH3120268.1 PACE efflux transporter [Serratia ureilytica]HEJ6931393.1 PACE efflux transporter [Serratia marcescens]
MNRHELSRTPTERVFHAVLFEVIANIIIAFSLAGILDVPVVQSGSLSVMSAAVAALWGYVFNWYFDRMQRRYQFRRTFTVRAFHAVFFEAGLIAIMLPVVMVILGLTLRNSLAVESGLVLFFLPYTFIFNWTYDLLRGRLLRS